MDEVVKVEPLMIDKRPSLYQRQNPVKIARKLGVPFHFAKIIPRLLNSQLQVLLRLFPAVTLLGPRQPGKTTLARTFLKRYFDCENTRDRTSLELEWETLIDQDTLLILDEAQNIPDIFRWLRSTIDDASAIRLD